MEVPETQRTGTAVGGNMLSLFGQQTTLRQMDLEKAGEEKLIDGQALSRA